MNNYSFFGTVMQFDNVISRNWRAETQANSKSKAIANIKFQYRKTHNLSNNVPLILHGVIKGGGDSGNVRV